MKKKVTGLLLLFDASFLLSLPMVAVVVLMAVVAGGGGDW